MQLAPKFGEKQIVLFFCGGREVMLGVGEQKLLITKWRCF